MNTEMKYCEVIINEKTSCQTIFIWDRKGLERMLTKVMGRQENKATQLVEKINAGEKVEIKGKFTSIFSIATKDDEARAEKEEEEYFDWLERHDVENA